MTNWNYSSAEFEESLYDVVEPQHEEEEYGERMEPVSQGKARVERDVITEDKAGGSEVRKSSAQFGIEPSSDSMGHVYYNVAGAPVVPMPQGQGATDISGSSERSRESDIREGDLEGGAGGVKAKVRREEPESLVDQSLSVGKFADDVREAIANVDASRREGDNRLMRVLEDLEEKMVNENAEEMGIMADIQRLARVTPRRSARLMKKRLVLEK